MTSGTDAGASSMFLATPQTFGNEGQHQRVEGHPFGLGARGQFGMNGLRHAGDKLAGFRLTSSVFPSGMI